MSSQDNNLVFHSDLIRLIARVDILEEQFDRHLPHIEKKLDSIPQQISDLELRLTREIHISRERQLRADNKIEWKFIGTITIISTIISSIVSGIIMVSKIFKG